MSKVTVFNGQLIVGEPTEEMKDEKPNDKTQSVVDWLEGDDD